MEILTALAVAGGIVGAVVATVAALRLPFRHPKTSRWYGLAQACGLTEIRSIGRFSDDLFGRFGSLEVLFGMYARSRTVNSTRLTVRGLSPHVAVRRESLALRVGKTIGREEVQIADEDFDRALYVQGDERVLRALLDGKTRKHLLTAFQGGDVRLHLAHGEMKAEFTDDLRAGRLPRRGRVRWLLRLAQRLQEPPDVSARLAENAKGDPIPAVRRNVLRTLERTAPADPATRAAMEHAVRADADGSVRLHAALWLGPHGTPALEALAVDGTVEDAVSSRAIDELGELLPFDRARSVLEQSMAAGRPLTAASVAMVLGRGGESEVLPLATAMERASGDVALAVARALGRTGSERAEGPLLAALRREGEDVQAAVAAALGQVGTAASVLPLTELAQGTRGLPYEPALGALVLIRRRLTGADPGRLSLAAGSDGQLAIADDERGRVALPEGDEPA